MSNVENQNKPLATTYIVCGVLIEKDGKFLLVQEKQPKAYKKWNLPAGKVDTGETLEQAAIREAKEECGYDVELVRELLVLHPAADRPVLHAYYAKIVGGELAFPEYEILNAKWFTRQEIVDMKDEIRTPEYVMGALQAL
jgi:ADP-ribose pyrophosphatase YjhB (NUDIX family)